MPLKKSKEKARAKFLYFTTSKTQKEIARLAGVSERGLTKWVVTENWKQKKTAAFHSPEQEVEHLYAELRELNKLIADRNEGERISTKQELETRTKILSLLAGPLKDTSHHWRNISPEFDFEPAVAADEDTKGPWGIKIKKRLPDGTYAYDLQTRHEYYAHYAQLMVDIDSGLYEFIMKQEEERMNSARAQQLRDGTNA